MSRIYEYTDTYMYSTCTRRVVDFNRGLTFHGGRGLDATPPLNIFLPVPAFSPKSSLANVVIIKSFISSLKCNILSPLPQKCSWTCWGSVLPVLQCFTRSAVFCLMLCVASHTSLCTSSMVAPEPMAKGWRAPIPPLPDLVGSTPM
jgi:hypothetical protein